MVIAACLLAPAAASAACTSQQRADARQALANVETLRAAGLPGARDAAQVVARARRDCAHLRFARAVTHAYLAHGMPSAGRQVVAQGIDLQGSAAGTWRIDLQRVAARAAGGRGRLARRHLHDWARPAGRGAVLWSDDPTRARWQPIEQSYVIAAMTGRAAASDVQLARMGVAAYGTRGRRAGLDGIGLIDHLRVARRLQLAARRAPVGLPTRAADAVARDALGRVARSPRRGWSRIDGRWSRVREHRSLLALAAATQRQTPHRAGANAIRKLSAALRQPPELRFEQLPHGVFYPWPRDQAWDTQSVRVDVDKPARLQMLVYAARSTPVRTVIADVRPGPAVISWDGTDEGGATLDAGQYRYNVEAVDPLGNRIRLPGLATFEIARDTDAPTARAATVRYVAARRRVVASWSVEERISPRVRTWLVLDRGANHRSIQLHDSIQRASVSRRVTLSRGTWRAALIFVDGSGNRTRRAAGDVVVR